MTHIQRADVFLGHAKILLVDIKQLLAPQMLGKGDSLPDILGAINKLINKNIVKSQDFVELIENVDDALALCVKRRPPEFWKSVADKLNAVKADLRNVEKELSK